MPTMSPQDTQRPAPLVMVLTQPWGTVLNNVHVTVQHSLHITTIITTITNVNSPGIPLQRGCITTALQMPPMCLM